MKIEKSIVIINVTKTLCIDKNVRDWCKFPYPNHPKGCPVYGKEITCPPKIKLITDIFDLDYRSLFIIIKFDIRKHAQRMLLLHPNWTDKQCRCCLYWQGTIKKQLKKKCKEFMKVLIKYEYTLRPEAMGVNVFATLQKHNIKIVREAYPILYKVAFLGRVKGRIYENFKVK